MYKLLHEPLKVGSITLASRLVMPPMATEKSDGGKVTEGLCAYYDEKTHGGFLGLVITEHNYVSPEGKASPNQIYAGDDSCIPGLRALAETIHKNDTPVLLQISHAGSAAKSAITHLPSISASAVENPCSTSRRMGEQSLPKEMDQKDIDRIIRAFTDAAIRAREAGYDGVEVHSAHGYLLDQFYSPLTNKRTDAYTGSTITGRTKLHAEIIRSIRDAAGPDFVISVRLGASDYQEGGADVKEVPEAARILKEAGADMISISGGMCDFFRPGHSEPGWFAELSEAVKQVPDLPVLLTGGIKTGDEAEELLKEGAADMIGIGRALLKDGRLPEKIMTA